MNFNHKSYVMAYSSIVLVVGFIISSILAGVLKKATASGIIIGLLVCFVLSVFALTGGNQGFAILWILLVPMFSINLLGVHSGLVVSTYFLVFLFAIFFTPINVSMADKYNAAFISRFPILYLCDYAIATFFSLQKLYYQNKLEYQAYSDGLTGLRNRRYFMESLYKCSENHKYSIIMIDLNGLKTVNDKLGHESGDTFICKVSHLFNEEFRNSAVCRIGGDEIAIISSESPEIIETKIADIKKQAHSISKKLPFDLSFSVGVATNTNEPCLSPEELLKKADANMYISKMEYYKDSNHNKRKR